MIERLGKPVAIAVATGALLAGCADMPSHSDTQPISTKNVTTELPQTTQTSKTTLPYQEPSCLPLKIEGIKDSETTTVSFDGIYAALVQKHVEFKPLSSKNPINNTTNASVERSASFLRITKDASGTICYESEATDEVSGPQVDNLLRAVVADTPFIQSALDKGELDEVDFRLVAEKDLLEKYSATEPQYTQFNLSAGSERQVINYPIDPRKPIQVTDIRTMLRHEAIHALTSKADMSLYNNVVDVARAKDFADACAALRSIAVDEASSAAKEVIVSLQAIAGEATPDQARIINKVIASVQNGSLDELQPVSSETRATQKNNMKYGNVPECKAIGPWYVALNLMDEEEIDTSDIKKKMIDGPYIGNAIDGWNDLFRQQTIYRTMREATYLTPNTTQTEHDDLAGHPWDNWDEMITSLLNVSVTYPETFVQNVHKLPPNQIKAIKTLMHESSVVFEQLHPEMKDVNETLQHVYEQL